MAIDSPTNGSTFNMYASVYQQLAARTIPSPDTDAYVITEEDTAILWAAVGIAGEAGETLDYIKKTIFHHHVLDKDSLIKELGDVLWYVAMLCTVTGLDMGTVMQTNVDKLRKRYPEGFNTEDSVKRVDVSKTDATAWACVCGTVNPTQRIRCSQCGTHRKTSI